jgi:pimeloyl-ACP methyl ester carboxylesterase
MGILDLKTQKTALRPDYWRAFDDIGEKDTAEVSRFSASDGHNLTVYEFGAPDRDSVVLVSALATPFLLLVRLAAQLAKRYHVLSWENRGGPFLREGPLDVALSVDRQARDMREIIADKGIGGFHVVSLCSGAPIVARAASETNLPIKSVSFYGPSGIGIPDTRSQYQDVFAPMIVELGADDTVEARRNAQVMQDYVLAQHGKDGLAGDIDRLTYLNMQDYDAIAGFARLMTEYWSGDLDERFARFDEMCRRHPVMIMHAIDDPIMHYSASVKGCLRTGLSKLVLYPTGGHFQLCERNSEIVRDLLTFMAEHDAPSGRDGALEWPALKPGIYLGPLWAVDWA